MANHRVRTDQYQSCTPTLQKPADRICFNQNLLERIEFEENPSESFTLPTHNTHSCLLFLSVVINQPTASSRTASIQADEET